MKLVNIALPKDYERKIAKFTLKRYSSAGEFVRSSIVKMLAQYSILPQAAKVEMLRKLVQERMARRGKIFDPVKELKEMRKIREGYARNS